MRRHAPSPLVGALSAATALLAVVGLSSCTAGSSASGTNPSAASASPPALTVATAFYPLTYLAEQVGAGRVQVTQVAPPGAEPHDLELTTADLKVMSRADLVVYLSGFMPAVDSGVQQVRSERVWDAAGAARLVDSPDVGRDPHFWLDPGRMADVADALAAEFARRDPAGAATYTAAAADLRSRLADLDRQMRTGLADCTSRTLVTSHEAFGYLARAYGLSQRGIAGLSAESEPSPRTLAEVSRFVRDSGVRTVYYETLISPDIARTVAAETGAATAALDPIEGLSDASAARDYLGLMQADLAALRTGQGCR